MNSDSKHKSVKEPVTETTDKKSTETTNAVSKQVSGHALRQVRYSHCPRCNCKNKKVNAKPQN